MTLYTDVFKKFKKRIEDKDLPFFSEDEQIEMLTEWLDTAIGYIELDGLRLENDLSDRDDELQQFNADLKNYEMEVVAMYMVAAWYEPKINSLEHILMYTGAKNEMPKQKEHYEMMVHARDKWKLEARKYFRNYNTKNNKYLSGE